MEDLKIHLKKFLEQDISDLRRYSRQGEIDGKNEYPSSDSLELSNAEIEILGEAESSWIKFKNEVSNFQQKIDLELEKTKSEIEGEISVNIDKISEDKNKELDLIEAEFGVATSEYKNLKGNFDAAEEEITEIRRLVNRSLEVKFVNIYIPVMILLSLAEVPVNRLAFELFFEQSPIISLALSLAIGSLFVFFAHIIGSQLRHSQCKELSPETSKIFGTLAALFFMSLLVMYFLGIMREQLVAVQNSANLNLEDLLNDDNQTSVTNGMTSLLIGSKGLMLLLLNLAIYISGVILAFFRHDPHPRYESASDNFEKAKTSLLKYQKRFEIKQVEKFREFNEKHSFNKSLQRKREASIESIMRNRELLRESLSTSRDKVRDSVLARIRAYRDANAKIRKTHVPKYFSNSIFSEIEGRVK